MDRNELAKITQQRNEDLAKSLGYRSFKEMKGSLSKKSLSGGINSRLEQGGGIAESIGGGIKSNIQSIKKSLNPKTFAKDIYNDLFDGDDFISAYMRGRIVDKPGESSEESKETTPPLTETLGKKVTGRDKKTGRFTKLTDDEQLAKQRKLGLTKITPTAVGEEEGGGFSSKFGSSVAGDVAEIRKSLSRLLSFEKENKEQSKSKAGSNFFKEQDAREAALEKSPSQITVEGGGGGAGPAAEESGGGGIGLGIGLGFLPKLFGFLKKGLIKGIKFLFKPSRLLKVLGKVFILATLFISLFKGITAGFDRYKETGNIGEAIVAGLGAVVDFLTFGLFGEDSLKKMFSAIGDFTKPIIDKIGSVFTGIMDWVKNNVGIPAIPLDIPVFGKYTIPAYYPFKDDPSNPNDVTSAPKPEPEAPKLTPHEQMKAEIMDSEEMQPDTDKLKGFGNTADGVSHLTKGQKVSADSLIGGFSDNSPTADDSPTAGLDSMLGGAESLVSQLPQSEALNKDAAAVQNFIQGGGVDSAMGNLSSGTTGVEGAMDNAGSKLTDLINKGGVTPSAVTPFGAATSGSVVDSGSVEVDSGQREESMGSGGNTFNNPTTTNNSNSAGENKEPVAPVINFEFADGYMRT